MKMLVTKSHLLYFVLPFLVCSQSCWAIDDAKLADLWSQTKSQGDAALDSHNYGLAESHLTQALSLAQRFGVADPRVAESLHSLIALYMLRGQYAKAEPLIERELRVNEKCLGAEHPKVVAQAGQLAEFCFKHGSKEKACRLVQLIVAFADRRLKDEQSLNGAFGTLEGWYRKDKVYDQAKQTLRQLQEQTRKAMGDENIEFAATFDSLAHVCLCQGKSREGEALLQKALSLRQEVLPPGHLALAASYENIGKLYRSQGKNDAAEPYFKKALAITQRTVPDEDSAVFGKIDALAKQEISLGHKSQAETLYRQALESSAAAGNRDQEGDASLALGQLYAGEGKYKVAEPLLKRALKLGEAQNGPSQACLVPVLQSYADVLEKLGRKSEAAQLRRRASTIIGTGITSSQM